MPWTADEVPDQSGRRVVVTGANSGIGAAAASVLAARGAEVVLAVRNTAAGQRAAESMAGKAEVRELDLADQGSVADFAQRILDEGRPVDLLVNNAGVMAPPRYRSTIDGHELQFGTNHLGHFALTARLLPALQAADAPRVTTVSSIAHHQGSDHVLAGNPAHGYGPNATYANSKLANLLFALELQRRATAAGSTLTSTAAHPGVSATNLALSPDGLGALPLVRRLAGPVMRAVLPGPQDAATAILYAATEAAPGSYTGPTSMRESRGPIGPARISRYGADPALAARLWSRSEELTALEFAL